MLLELTLRNETPIELRISLLALLLIVGLFYAAIPKWIQAQYSLASLPFQKFDWMSQEHSKNIILRVSSIFCIATVYSVFTFSYLESKSLSLVADVSYNYLLILGIIVVLTFIKLVANQAYFSVHKHRWLGDLIIDFQYSVNVLFAIVISLIMVYDVFFLRMDSGIFYITTGLLILLFLIKLFGTILLLQNKFNYPLITVFIYLCTAEIVPALVAAKVLFVNS